MNYDGPRQIADGPSAGKWHYTTKNRRTGTHSIGYCRESCPGHDTAEEACEHQTRYSLDRELRLDGRRQNQVLRCEARSIGDEDACGAYTEHFAQVGEWIIYTLCDQHRTREVVADLLGTVGESMHS